MQNDCFTQAALAYNAQQQNEQTKEQTQVINPVVETPQLESTTPKEQPTMETKKEETAKPAEIKEAPVKKVNKIHEYREHLKTITNGLVECAKAAGRTDYKNNQLLRELYNVVEATLDTFDGWKEKGFSIKKGEHALLFWGMPIESATGVRYCPIEFLFSQDQVRQNLAS